MSDICFYFQVHQPIRLRRIHAFQENPGQDYWAHTENRAILDRTARKCYLPANRLIQELIEASDGDFRVAYSISGVLLEQLEHDRPDVLQSFQDLVDTGHVEILAETYHHSLAGLWEDPGEFKAQVARHHRTIERLFGQTPTTFRNTELIYDDRIAERVEAMGYDTMLTEGTEHILGDRSPNHVYRPAREGNDLRLLLKNYRLSDDVAFRFSTPGWRERPLTADKYAHWLAETPADTINLFMDYETFGEHQWPETGIFEFLRHLPREATRHPDLRFALPREIAARHEPKDTIEVPHAISWADAERDVSAWLGNKMQHACFEELRQLGPVVQRTGDTRLIDTWRRLQTSDHLYYCSTKTLDDQDIHAYFSPYDSPYLAFVNYKNAIDDLAQAARSLIREQVRTRHAGRASERVEARHVRQEEPDDQDGPVRPHNGAAGGRAPVITRPR